MMTEAQEREYNEKMAADHKKLFNEIVGEVLEETKCECCGTHLDYTIFQKNGNRRYLLGGALIIEAPDTVDGIKIVECWEEGESWYTPVSYWITRTLNAHFVPQRKRAKMYSNIFMSLHKPFMNINE